VTFWNEFFRAMVFIQDDTTITVPVSLDLLIYSDVSHRRRLMAAPVATPFR
jgi:ABC-type glycerol-3-phosphate transport system permease component